MRYNKQIIFLTIILIIINTSCTIVVTTKNESESTNCDVVNQVFNSEGQVKISFFLNVCSNETLFSSSSYISAAKWTVDRLNQLNSTIPLRLGLSIFETCNEIDYFSAIFKMYKDENYLGGISNEAILSKVQRFGDYLDVRLSSGEEYSEIAVKAAIKLLKFLGFVDNVTVITENRQVMQKFYDFARDERICVTDAEILGNAKPKLRQGPSVIITSTSQETRTFLNSNLSTSESPTIFIPLNPTETDDLLGNIYIVQPSDTENIFSSTNFSSKPVPVSLLFEVSNSIIDLILNLTTFNENCNESCLLKKSSSTTYQKLTPLEVVNLFKISPLTDSLMYKIFHTSLENTTSRSIGFYNIFNDTLSNLEEPFENITRQEFCSECTTHCLNFYQRSHPKTILISYPILNMNLRPESWVFAFLSISILGVVFCVAILIFFIVRFCKRDILEGNPLLSLLLLLSVVCMYCSVIPFALQSGRVYKNSICLSRALSTTLSFAFALSLLLARNILLATASKEVGFMSHVPGPVQSFLTLFIFGVQGALSLQFVNHCEDIFRGVSFVYLMSYNIILLVLLVFICPLNTKAHRNYKEGKYFTVAVILMAFAWSCWIPGYAVLEDGWKDPILCLGLVSTASILLGTIFIPRTYMMTVAAARDRITNGLPSMHTTSSIMDVYRASSQPVYDCINIAAINAAAVARNGGPPPPPPPQTEVYSSRLPTPYEEEFDFERCITPTQDKVTRF